MINIRFVCFAASRYWKEPNVLQDVYGRLEKQLTAYDRASCQLVVDGEGIDGWPKNSSDALVIVPMSGAVQPHILKAAELFSHVIIYPMYILGNAPEDAANRMLINNAAPTTMDCWGVLRRRHPNADLVQNPQQLEKVLRVHIAHERMKQAKLILIGEVEPWVVSVGRDLSVYQRMGIAVEKVSDEEVSQAYQATSAEDAQPYIKKYKDHASSIVEPTPQDILNAARMAAALVRVLENHQADGMAIACFDLLRVGTNACLGVSFIGDCTDKIAACEGDLDSACTMLMMKHLTNTKLWMANPGLHPGGVVNFSHCTAPIAVDKGRENDFILRSHHESGIGASLQVSLPLERKVTACRISAEDRSITIQTGTSVAGPYENACRTQMYVKFDDYNRYINTAIGCHQVFCFDDISDEMTLLAGKMELTLL